MKINYLECPSEIPLVFSSLKEKDFTVTQPIEIKLSDGRVLYIPKGYRANFSNSPKWFRCSNFSSNEKLTAHLIHSRLWTEQVSEIEYFGTIYEAFQFSNEELFRWKTGLTPNKKLIHFLEKLYYKYYSINHYIKKR